MSPARELVWDVEALEGMKEAFDYIKEDSPKSAEKLVNEVRDTLEQVRANPKIFQADRFMVDNGGEYRAFEIWSYRVTYRYTAEQVQILRVRHSSQSPLEY